VTIAGSTLSGNSATVSNCIMTGNVAFDGGAIDNEFLAAAPAAISNCTFSNNSATFLGGAILNEQGAAMTLTGCSLAGNSVTGYVDPSSGSLVNGAGGAIANDSYSVLTLTVRQHRRQFRLPRRRRRNLQRSLRRRRDCVDQCQHHFR
jgi:hypothetical protein